MRKIKTKLIAFIVAISISAVSITSVSAFDTSYISKDGMELAYSIINGYSKLSERKGLTSFNKAAVYSGLDVSKPSIIALAALFYFTNGLDIDRAMTDNEYAVSMVDKLNGFLSNMGVKNDRAAQLKAELETDGVQIEQSFDTAGMFIVNSNKEYCKTLMENENVDFVLVDGKVPVDMKDINMDGKCNAADGTLIQKYLANMLEIKDSDELEYIKFACDINGDKTIDILDATEAMRK